MKIDANSLPDDPVQLKKMLLELQATTTRALAEKDKELAKQREIIHGLLERYEIARSKAFGKSSEQNPGKDEIFNEAEETLDEALGLGPLEDLLANKAVSEVMVVGPRKIYYEEDGKNKRSDIVFTDNKKVLNLTKLNYYENNYFFTFFYTFCKFSFSTRFLFKR